MTNSQIIRAWKDENYRESLAEAELSLLPENPAGVLQLTDHDLASASAAARVFGPDDYSYFLIGTNCLATYLSWHLGCFAN